MGRGGLVWGPRHMAACWGWLRDGFCGLQVGVPGAPCWADRDLGRMCSVRQEHSWLVGMASLEDKPLALPWLLKSSR